MEVNILTFGDTEHVAKRFEAYAARGQHTRELMDEIALDMLRIEGVVFSSGGRRGGGSWKRLKKDTIRKKGNAEILFTAGARPGYSDPGGDALFRSLTVENAPYQIMEIDRNSILFGTTVPAAAITQATRPFLRFTANDIARWDQIILEFLMGK